MIRDGERAPEDPPPSGASPPTDDDLLELLENVQAGRTSPTDALCRLRGRESPTLHLDFDRERRCGFPEVIFGSGKSREELRVAATAIYRRHGRVLVTRLDGADGQWLADSLPDARFHSRARCLTAVRHSGALEGHITVLCAGTSDAAVAEEARVTAEWAGSRVETHYDVGVAGLHRLLAIQEALRPARVHIVVAGMEGALPSVVAGLTPCPVIAVPTSIGYGASFQGLAPLLAMLNSCAAGVAVVNIDNGFGAGILAHRINVSAATMPRKEGEY